MIAGDRDDCRLPAALALVIVRHDRRDRRASGTHIGTRVAAPGRNAFRRDALRIRAARSKRR
jgi:hypothetical protein